MKKVLIESIAQALSKDPLSLSSLELRKLCILIDWTMALETYQQGNTFTPLLSDKIVLSDAKVEKLSSQLISAIQADGFPELDLLKPDSEQMDDMFKRLGVFLGYNQLIINDMLSGTGFISDYEKQIQKQGLIYTDYLQYKKQLTDFDVNNLNQTTAELALEYPWLENQSLVWHNPNNNTIEINTQLLIPQHVTATQKTLFILALLEKLVSFKRNHCFPISEHCLQFLIEQLKQSISQLVVESSHFIILKQIEVSLTELIKQSKKWSINNELCAHLAKIITHCPVLRGWSTLSQCRLDQPIHRIILMGHEDVTDDEVTATVNVMKKNHPNENIAITYTPDDVVKANLRNQVFSNFPFTLQVIGHGTQQSGTDFTANLGSFRGDAVTTGRALAQLVNACANIHHIRLSCCFSGQVDAEQMKQVTLFEKERSKHSDAPEVRKTFTLVSNGILTAENCPFALKTAAMSCWNALQLNGRNISMTVSPGIIEPDVHINRMVWKPSIDDLVIGVKEIRITTERGPKYLPFWQAQSKSPESLEGNTLDYRSNKNNLSFNPFSI